MSVIPFSLFQIHIILKHPPQDTQAAGNAPTAVCVLLQLSSTKPYLNVNGFAIPTGGAIGTAGAANSTEPPAK